MKSYSWKPIIFCLFLWLPYSGQSQSPGIFLELGGSAGFASLNFERSFLTKKNLDLKWRVGFSTLPIDKNNGISLIFPVLAEVLVGKGAHKFEGGLGQTFTVSTQGNIFLLMPAVIGYRYQPPDKRIFFRASYTPIISYLLNFQYQNWGGLSIGYRFN